MKKTALMTQAFAIGPGSIDLMAAMKILAVVAVAVAAVAGELRVDQIVV